MNNFWQKCWQQYVLFCLLASSPEKHHAGVTDSWISHCRCTTVQLTPVAVLKDSAPYNSTDLSNEKSGTVDLSCNEVPIKLSHSGKQRTSKPKRIRLTKDQKKCAPVNYTKGETFQLSQKLVNPFEKQRKLQTTRHRKGRKTLQPNSLLTFTLAPQRKASKEKEMITQKFKMETILQSIDRTPKASFTHSPSTSSETKLVLVQKTMVTQSKQISVTKPKARTLRNKKKRGKNKTQKSCKSQKGKKIKTPKQWCSLSIIRNARILIFQKIFNQEH